MEGEWTWISSARPGAFWSPLRPQVDDRQYQGDYIFTGDNDNLVKLFSSTSTSLIRTFKGHTDLVRTIALDLDTGILVSGGYDSIIKMWNIETGECLRTLRMHSGLVFDVGMKAGRLISYVNPHVSYWVEFS